MPKLPWRGEYSNDDLMACVARVIGGRQLALLPWPRGVLLRELGAILGFLVRETRIGTATGPGGVEVVLVPVEAAQMLTQIIWQLSKELDELKRGTVANIETSASASSSGESTES